MRKRVKKISFKGGKDASTSVARSLCANFIKNDSLQTTRARAFVTKSLVDRLTYKAIRGTGADMNMLYSFLRDKVLVDKLINRVAPLYPKGVGGFVKVVRTGIRRGDGAHMARVLWVTPVKEVIKKPTVKKNDSKVRKSKEKV